MIEEDIAEGLNFDGPVVHDEFDFNFGVSDQQQELQQVISKQTITKVFFIYLSQFSILFFILPFY